MEGNNLVELLAQIHAPVIDTGLFSCVLCFCLLVIHAVYFNNNISQVVEIFRVVACRIQEENANN